MPAIEAFHGLRYDLGHVGSLSDVVAPPYDVIDRQLQDELYKKHPTNAVRLILNRAEPGDTSPNNRYDRAARFLKHWRAEGVLQAESQAAIYFYKQCFEAAGQSRTRSGFMCRVRLEPFGTGKIYPHEETHSAAKADRLKLLTACRANLSQVFGLYPDSENRACELLNSAVQGKIHLEATDHLGVIHRMWPVTDVRTISKLRAIMDPLPIFIADGHHRYETACNYRDGLSSRDELPSNHPANFVLMMCVGMNDPGMIVLPTHRLFRGLTPMSSDQLISKLGDCFETRIMGEGADRAGHVWDEIEAEDDQQTLGLFTAKDERWVVAHLTEAGRARMDRLAPDQSEHWRGLGVSLLHRLVIDDLCDASDLPKPMYVHTVSEVVQGIEQGDTVGRDATGQEGKGCHFPLVAMVMPATLEHIRAISEQGERMPAKSTYFYPKVLSGLVINALE